MSLCASHCGEVAQRKRRVTPTRGPRMQEQSNPTNETVMLVTNWSAPPKYRFFKWTAFLDLWGTQNHKLEAQNQAQQSQPILIKMGLSAGNWHHPGTLGPCPDSLGLHER